MEATIKRTEVTLQVGHLLCSFTLILMIQILADRILLAGLKPDQRKKYEQLITELVHQRDVSRALVRDKIVSNTGLCCISELF